MYGNNNDDDNNNAETGCCCCPIITEETEEIKKYKPFLIGGIIIYIIMLFLDLFYLSGVSLFSYGMIIFFLCLMVVNRCYMIFIYYTFFSLIMLFQTIIPGFGVPLQSGFPNDKSIGAFVIYLFMFIFYFAFFYFAFKAYKEMKYTHLNSMRNRPQLSNGLQTDFMQNNYYGNNYGGNYGNSGNNNPPPSSGGFKAFSGKGYAVGGS